ncbi:MAG: hypothetical protein IT366_22120 [Candidatus Hydrogenedentes bacterium]|nr:hypothetical protein [Candidatus Hydrogenedentota bacterium]
MYFWNLHALKAMLKERPLTDHEALPYYFVVAFLMQLDVYASTYFASVEPSSSSVELLSSAIYHVIVLAGILWAYIRNGGRNGYSFFSRYFAIGWVVGIRLLVAIIAPLILLMAVFIAAELYGISNADTTFDIVINLFGIIIEIVYCYLVARNVGEVADAWPKEGPPAITHDAGNTPAISDVSAA